MGIWFLFSIPPSPSLSSSVLFPLFIFLCLTPFFLHLTLPGCVCVFFMSTSSLSSSARSFYGAYIVSIHFWLVLSVFRCRALRWRHGPGKACLNDQKDMPRYCCQHPYFPSEAADHHCGVRHHRCRPSLLSRFKSFGEHGIFFLFLRG